MINFCLPYKVFGLGMSFSTYFPLTPEKTKSVDKKIGLKTAHNALNLCIEEIIQMAKDNNIKLLYTVTA